MTTPPRLGGTGANPPCSLTVRDRFRLPSWCAMNTMSTRYRLVRRGSRGGRYYCVDTKTGQRLSLNTSEAADAQEIVDAKNKAAKQPALNLQLAKAYMAGTDHGIATHVSSVERSICSVLPKVGPRGRAGYERRMGVRRGSGEWSREHGLRRELDGRPKSRARRQAAAASRYNGAPARDPHRKRGARRRHDAGPERPEARSRANVWFAQTHGGRGRRETGRRRPTGRRMLGRISFRVP